MAVVYEVLNTVGDLLEAKKPREGVWGNFEVILMQMSGPEFQNQPYSYI